MSNYLVQDGSFRFAADGRMATSDCGECCGLYVPGDWCICNQGEDPENQYVVPLDDFGGATDPITTSIDGLRTWVKISRSISPSAKPPFSAN